MGHTYYAKRYVPGTAVIVKGVRHPMAGQVGVVMKVDPVDCHKFWIRVRGRKIVLEGKNLTEVKVGGTTVE